VNLASGNSQIKCTEVLVGLHCRKTFCYSNKSGPLGDRKSRQIKLF